MEPSIVFHRLVQRDMDGLQRYYLEEAGESVADRFFQLFLKVVERAASNPKRYHPVSTALRRQVSLVFHITLFTGRRFLEFASWCCAMIGGIHPSD